MVFGITQLAESAPSGDILATLGIDLKLLLFQIVAFLVLVVLLGKFVFPVFIKIVDKRQAAIEESNKAAVDASKHAEKAQHEISELLRAAREEASGIVGTAKDEARDLVLRAEERSKAQAESIVTAAKADIAKEVVAAKKALHNETLALVVLATEKVASKQIAASTDKALIKKALEDIK